MERGRVMHLRALGLTGNEKRERIIGKEFPEEVT